MTSFTTTPTGSENISQGQPTLLYPGEALAVQHFFSIKASETNIISKDPDGNTWCDIRTFNWLIAPALDIRAIGLLPARWLLRDSICAKALKLLLEEGGLTFTGTCH